MFDFHGHGGTAKHAARTHHLHETWPEAIVVYMQGLNTPGKLIDPEGKKSGWQSGPGDQKDRDLNFFDAVLASMKKDYRVDERRIYSTGHSNGGGFTYLLWAKRGDTFAAFVPVAAAAGLYFADAKPKPLFHAASEKDAARHVCHATTHAGPRQEAKWLRRFWRRVGEGVPALLVEERPAGRDLPSRRRAQVPRGDAGSDRQVLPGTGEKVTPAGAAMMPEPDCGRQSAKTCCPATERRDYLRRCCWWTRY